MYNQIDSNKRKTFLLIAIFIALIGFIGWIFSQTTNWGNNALYLAILISIAMSAVSFFAGDKIALAASGAQGPITKEKNSYVYNLVENLCLASGLPAPKIYLIPDNGINAFATGRNPQNASLAITQGAIDKLENEELEGVIAHELSHIKNYDIRLMMIVAVLVGTAVLLSRWFWHGQMFGGKRDSDNGRNQAQTILMIVGFILLILSPVIAQLIKLAISRKREFLADASASLMTRYPEGLARALEKISHENQPLEKANNALAHLYISNPFSSQANSGMAKLFSTHPPLAERIKTLRSMA